MPVDHFPISVPASQFDSLVAFLESSLAHLGVKVLRRMNIPPNNQPIAGIGEDKLGAYLWISCLPAELETNEAHLAWSRKAHIAFLAENAQQVRDFYTLAMKAGAQDDGAPGIRAPPMYPPNYYAAFVRDPASGMKWEVVCRNGDV